MARIENTTATAEVVLQPHRAKEGSLPQWLITLLEVRTESRTLMSSVLSLTESDLRDLAAGLAAVANQSSQQLAFAGTDEDLFVRAEPASHPDHVYFGFWFGEPYQLMSGNRIVVTRDALRAFSASLEDETDAVAGRKLDR